ncbi:MAG: SUF system Fe-S cluster assembly regulator, partial [Salinisphaeraceae bacterium]|nr:SUF system Fe-S cluster assembly regulator [Salinisphaeraceae bacterium]
MLRLSKMTDYGTVVMTALARNPETLRSTADIAEEAHIAAPTASKLLKALVHGNLVESVRGAHGGYRLARPAKDIPMAEIITVLEGPIAMTECAVHDGKCGIESDCDLRGNWQLINRAILGALESVSLADMVRPL